MSTLLLLTRDQELAGLIRGVLPEGWEVKEAQMTALALQALDAGRVDVVCADLELAGGDGLNFLRQVHQRLDPAPAYVLFGPGEINDTVRAQAAGLQVRHIFTRPLQKEKIREALGALCSKRDSAAMTLLEWLASGYKDPSTRQVTLSVDGATLSLVFGQGMLWTAHHPLFVERYRKALTEAGFELPPPSDGDPMVDLAEVEEKFAGHPELPATKRGALLSIMASFALQGACDGVVGPAVVPEGLSPVDIPSLLVSLVDHVPETVLQPLKLPRVTFAVVGDVIPADLAIRPEHGYLLSQCSTPRRPPDLVQTGIMSEKQVFSGLYLLVLLGLLVTHPDVGHPFRLAALAEEARKEDTRIRRQSEAIAALVRHFQVPGQSPYQILGVPHDVSPQEAIRASETMQSRLGEAHLHPEVFRAHQKDLLFLSAKVSEAYLMLQEGFLKAKSAQPVTAEVQEKGGLSPENVRKESTKLTEMARHCLEEDQVYEASQYLKLALFHDPQNADGHHLLARVYELNPSGRAKHMAEKELLIALKLDPQNLDYVLDAAEFYARHGLVQRCRTFLDRAQAIELRNPRALAIRKAIKGK